MPVLTVKIMLVRRVKNMGLPQAYIDYLVHFHGDRDYFECHEILEEYWKKVDDRNKHSIWVGLIQLAVANYHHRRGNFTGSSRTYQKSLSILSLYEDALRSLKIDAPLLLKIIQQRLLQTQENQAYTSMNIPLISQDLIAQCIKRCEEFHFIWASESDLTNVHLVHRHKKRDRSQVVNERLESLQQKTKRRQ
jgi:predicted metal-dependent hydrolase